MNRRICSLLVAAMHITSWALLTNGLNNEGYIVHSPQVVYQTNQGYESIGRPHRKEMGESKRLSKRIGSRPPNCDHKCKGCKPCYAIQVPEITDHLGLLFANYEPEGWKCKCGTSFFNP